MPLFLRKFTENMIIYYKVEIILTIDYQHCHDIFVFKYVTEITGDCLQNIPHRILFFDQK